jgi:PleD family two-component response regulator
VSILIDYAAIDFLLAYDLLQAARVDTRETILVVEDDPLGLEVLTNFLAQGGYRVVSASNGQEGLERLQNTRPQPLPCAT